MLPEWLWLCVIPAVMTIVVFAIVAGRRPFVSGAIAGVVGAAVFAATKLFPPPFAQSLRSIFPQAETALLTALAVQIVSIVVGALVAALAFIDRRRAVGVTAMLGVVTAIAGTWAVAPVFSTLTTWNLPAFDFSSPVDGHMGHATNVEPPWRGQLVTVCSLLVFCEQQKAPPGPPPLGCRADPVPVRFERTPSRAEVTGQCSFRGLSLSIRRPFDVVGVEELGSPYFPLRVGNEWRYEVVVETKDATSLVDLVAPETSTSVGPFTLTIRRDVDFAGFHAFELALKHRHTTSSVFLAAVEGEVRWVNLNGRGPALVPRGDKLWFEPIGLITSWERGGPGVLAGPRLWFESDFDPLRAVGDSFLLRTSRWTNSRWDLVGTTEGTGPAAPTLPPLETTVRSRDAVTAERIKTLLTRDVESVRFEQCIRKHPDRPKPLVFSFSVLPSGDASAVEVNGDEALGACLERLLRPQFLHMVTHEARVEVQVR